MQTTLIDLRSDTVTRPTPEMLEAMFHAEVGDDVFDEDPTIRRLEEKTARLFGKEAGLFCPSGTMTNQIAIKVLTQPMHEVICDKLAHIYYYEGGGVAFNSLVSMRLLDGDRGRFTAEQVLDNINPRQNIYQPYSSLVSIENTCNKGGGSYYRLEQIRDISGVCKTHDLKMHLDGARIFNALIETGDSAAETASFFDTVSVCLSKGLGAPVGSVLVSTRENIDQAKRVRKVFGGGMRQAGYLAAAGIYALDHHVDRLKDDHRRASQIKGILERCHFVEEILPVETNIVIFRIVSSLPLTGFMEALQRNGIKAAVFGKQTVRMVTHLDFNDDMLSRLEKALLHIKS